MTDSAYSIRRAPGLIHREPLLLKHGQASDYYVDVKRAYGDTRALNAICDAMWKQLDPRTTCVAGGGHGGIPLVSVLTAKHRLKGAYVRDGEKGHGKGGVIDGYVPIKEDYVSLVDDVWTTGQSMRRMIDVMSPIANVVGCYAVVRRGSGNLHDLRIPVHHLLTAEDLL